MARNKRKRNTKEVGTQVDHLDISIDMMARNKRKRQKRKAKEVETQVNNLDISIEEISIEEQFDINDMEWTMSKCKRFLQFVQKNSNATSIKKEPGDENHLFLPKYLDSK